ncbi:MAG TPA: 2-pyrone-4,6-dicarboxylate hydrolase [Gammaproteobacteria bacterium]|nr:2-pyrone-4,6-dicarboxylate hydrolase [Gammaproteobacteria bacterium]HBX27199.1 2-pyrone-4,6-dicarboxylate hydrolase [Gammaproteobacteria bacterium]
MDPDYLPFHPNPKKPSYQPPAGAVDAHCHVFGPADQFPYHPKRKYTPCDAPKEKLFELRDYLGFSRNVIVQASCHGSDNSALVDALEASGDLARGVSVLSPEVTDHELRQLDNAGVRGVRFNFVKRLVDSIPREVFIDLADRVKPFDWHIVVYFESPDLADLKPFIESLARDQVVVVDHMGRPDVGLGPEGSEFKAFMSLLYQNTNIWTKVSCPERLTKQAPDYSDVVPFAKALVEAFPTRVLWGTDWPHPNMKSHTPDDGSLVDIIPLIAETEELRRQLLIENPMRLYWNS